MNQEDIFKLLQCQARKIQERVQTPAANNLLSEIKLKCPGSRDALTYCLSCSNCSVTCIDQECRECYTKHIKCQRMKKIKHFHNQIQDTVQPSFILAQIEQSINSIKNTVTDMEKTIRNQLKNFKLTQADRQIVDKIRSYHLGEGNINSSDFIRHQEERQKQRQIWFEEQTKKFQQIMQSARQKVFKRFQSIHKAIYYEHFQNSPIFDQRIFNPSNILQNKVWRNQMLLILKDLRPMQSVKRIYCASTDAFLAQSFHKLCDNKPNLLYIVRNQFDKTYGGFSPCPISWSREEQFQIDDSMSSFIFSLDLHLKANLVNKQFSVRNSYKPKHKGHILIAFGNHASPNLVVSENSFAFPRDNWIDMYGGAYQQNTDNLYDLIGTRDQMMCKLKEFEVFQVTFADHRQHNVNIAQNQTQQCQKPSNYVEQHYGHQQKKQIIKLKLQQKPLLKQDEHENTEKVELKERKIPKTNKNNTKPLSNTKQKTKGVKKDSKPVKKNKEEPTQKKKASGGKQPERKRGRPKKAKPEYSSSEYMCVEQNQFEDQEDQGNNDEPVDNLFMHQLFGMPHDGFTRLGLLFGQNQQQQSYSNEGGDWQPTHQGRGGSDHSRRSHYW